MILLSTIVTPHAGVWIETVYLMSNNKINESRPMRACGLKQTTQKYCFVDKVTPHAGVWIETLYSAFCSLVISSRPMRACGLKQNGKATMSHFGRSRPMRACGLKHHDPERWRYHGTSRPMRACGLKHRWMESLGQSHRHAPCGRVD